MNTALSSAKTYACRNATISSSSMTPDHQRRRHHADGPAPAPSVAEQEHDAEERQDHEVARRHVAEETDRQRERLDQLAEISIGAMNDRHRHRARAVHARERAGRSVPM